MMEGVREYAFFFAISGFNFKQLVAECLVRLSYASPVCRSIYLVPLKGPRMRKVFLTITGICLLLCCSVFPVRAQQTRIAEREVEWNQHALPQTLFTRQVDPDNVVLFQVPSDWKKQAGEHLSFLGPNNSSLTVFAQKIPDGYPLRDFISALIEPLRNL